MPCYFVVTIYIIDDVTNPCVISHYSAFDGYL
jgi:hypothetical protein